MCDHEWKDEYYGTSCTKCDLFYAHGQAPWEDFDWEDYEDEDEPTFDCGWIHPTGGCSMAGSEECDFECPYRDTLYRERRRRLRQARVSSNS